MQATNLSTSNNRSHIYPKFRILPLHKKLRLVQHTKNDQKLNDATSEK